MQKNKMFKFEYSYLSLPKKLYSLSKKEKFPKIHITLLNKDLCTKLDLTSNNKKDMINILFNDLNNTKSFSQSYAGHQFGNFTKLGDGRAIIIGELITSDKKRFDIQLKGSGRTPYSRNGDGKATYKSMLREYLISEAMYYLNISSSRSLAVIKTGEKIHRKNIEEGGILARIMKSHIRIGTFEYASFFCKKDDLKALTTYTIDRLYPKINNYKNPPLHLLKTVMEKQIDLVVNWMRIGFIHGVMNTDNTSISGETFDYGPCAFLNSYKPEKTYSSIDHYNRYSYGNQPIIIKWNIARFAESLLPIIHQNQEKSIKLAQSVIDQFDLLWKKKYYEMMLKKIGIQIKDEEGYKLIDELLACMLKNNQDYNNTFHSLSNDYFKQNSSINNLDFVNWKKKWKKNLLKHTTLKKANNLMRIHNPVIIPRNHIVEEAIYQAGKGNINPFKKLIEIISKPYEYKNGLEKFMEPPSANFEQNFQTFCGT
ncbi:MAG: hypothetical protein CMP49_00215 [Flavobacteriales bacterium]|nr:hypothetical protein [Flavobacteriales bacterium]|tara:strand:- start:810 stop:2255 length:1446 start_codon:yes stop_codon:yes gene_type:complete